ncbi:MAG: hypothetical protein JNM48_02205 [Rhodospirillales bacterium]|nr:hypothetical protein [Rhodospirillales bacterium]
MKSRTWKAALILLPGLLCAAPAVAQKGMGNPTGVAREVVKPLVETMSGTIKDIKIGPCERTTGRSAEGAHLIVKAEDGRMINLHLGPAAALDDVLDHLSAGQQITFEGFRTDTMPQDAYVAKSLKVGDQNFDLRDEGLRPNWAIGPRGAGGGGGPGMAAGRGQGQGRGAGGCYW